MQTIATNELKTMMKDNTGLTVVNALPEESARDAHIPGTPNIPLDSENFVKQVETQAGGKSKPVVVYCASSGCNVSEKAARRLESEGFEKVYDYEGGVKAWQESA